MVLRLWANWPISFSLTSPMMPRPNWATLPVMCSSVVTTHLVVPSAWGSSWAVISASALPLPPVSRPWPFSTALWLASSRSTKWAWPLNAVEIGPSFTLTTPR